MLARDLRAQVVEPVFFLMPPRTMAPPTAGGKGKAPPTAGKGKSPTSSTAASASSTLPPVPELAQGQYSAEDGAMWSMVNERVLVNGLPAESTPGWTGDDVAEEVQPNYPGEPDQGTLERQAQDASLRAAQRAYAAVLARAGTVGREIDARTNEITVSVVPLNVRVRDDASIAATAGGDVADLREVEQSPSEFPVVTGKWRNPAVDDDEEMSSGAGPSAGPPVTLAPPAQAGHMSPQAVGAAAAAYPRPVAFESADVRPPQQAWTAKQLQQWGEEKLKKEEEYRRSLAHQAGAASKDLLAAMQTAANKAAELAARQAMVEHIQKAAWLLDGKDTQAAAELLAAGPMTPPETPVLSEEEQEKIHKAAVNKFLGGLEVYGWRRWMKRVLAGTEAEALLGVQGDRRKRLLTAIFEMIQMVSHGASQGQPVEMKDTNPGMKAAGAKARYINDTVDTEAVIKVRKKALDEDFPVADVGLKWSTMSAR